MAERLRVFLLLAVVISQIPSTVMAQESNNPSGQAWYYLHNSLFVSNRISYVHDIGFRHEFPVQDMWRIYYRPGIRYAAGDVVDLIGGLAFYKTYEKNESGNFEFRPWQGVRIGWPACGRFHLDHFFRLEERFFHQSGEPGWSPALRTRYKLNLILPLNHNSMTEKTLFLRANAEFFYFAFLDADRERYYHRRFGIGFGYRVDPRWTLETLYAFTNTSGIPSDESWIPVNVYQVRVRRALFPN